MGIFKKATELEKVTKEREALVKQVQDMKNKISQVNNALMLAQTEAMVDGTATAKKKVDKFQSALKGFEKELQSLDDKLQKVNEKFSKLTYEKRQVHFDSIAELDAEGYERGYRGAKLYEKLNELRNKVSGMNGNSSPIKLMREVGFSHTQSGQFRASQEHSQLVELWDDKKKDVQERVNAEFDELVKKIAKFLGE